MQEFMELNKIDNNAWNDTKTHHPQEPNHIVCIADDKIGHGYKQYRHDCHVELQAKRTNTIQEIGVSHT